MELERRRRNFGCHRSFKGVSYGSGLVAPLGYEEDLFCLQDGAYPLGDGLEGNLINRIEEAGVVPPSLFAERDHGGLGIEWRAGFVEGDVAVAPDAEKLDVYARRAHELVVAPGFPIEVGCSAIGGYHRVIPQVDKFGESPCDDVSVSLGMVGIEADVLVEQIYRCF